jgi:hypothetical protein
MHKYPVNQQKYSKTSFWIVYKWESMCLNDNLKETSKDKDEVDYK